MESLESVGESPAALENDRTSNLNSVVNGSLRRRNSSKMSEPDLDLSWEAESSCESAVNDDRNEINKREVELESAGQKNEAIDEEKFKIAKEESSLKFVYRTSAPAHRIVKESPLSSSNIFKQSTAGLLNLCIVLLLAVNGRLIIENLMKYGWLIKSGFWFSSRSLSDWPLLMCCLSLPFLPLAAFLVEKLVQKNYIAEPVRLCCSVRRDIDAHLLHCVVEIGVLWTYKL